MPMAMQRTSDDPPSRQLKGYTPLSPQFISQPQQPLPPNQKCHRKTPRRRAGAAISAHVNMQDLQLHCCKSPLKVAQPCRRMSSDRSLSASDSALNGDNRWTPRQGEHGFDSGVRGNYQRRTKGSGRGETDCAGWGGQLSTRRHNNT